MVLCWDDPDQVPQGQQAQIAVIAGVTWLALIGGVFSAYILIYGGGGGHQSSLPAYAAYNVREAVPTGFGSLAVTDAELTPVADSVEVHVSMRLDNNQDAQIDTPRLGNLRLVDTIGDEANPRPGAWSGPAVVLPHSSATIDLTYLARKDVGLLWLKYDDPQGRWPLRVVMGAA